MEQVSNSNAAKCVALIEPLLHGFTSVTGSYCRRKADNDPSQRAWQLAQTGPPSMEDFTDCDCVTSLNPRQHTKIAEDQQKFTCASSGFGPGVC